MKARHRIAVRTLVEMVLRSGDLDMRFSVPGRLVEGIRAHQVLQRQRPEGYRAEVPVSIEVETRDLVLVVSGRIDGVLTVAGATVVEEIKTTSEDLAHVADRPDACHWGQVKAYAWLLAREEQLEAVEVRLTYFQLDTGETLALTETMTRDELKAFFDRLVDRYTRWAVALSDWQALRNAAIKALDFPFASYRAGQRDMAVAVYRTIRDGGNALVQASTGIGKTLAALFPAIKTIGEGHVDRIFYLTARNTGQAAAVDALAILQDNGLRLKRIVLTAKDRTCFCPEAACRPEDCQYAKGHYDRLADALDAAFALDDLNRSVIENVARSHRVCPFALALEMARWADCIIGDYNYAFDPRVYLRRFFDEENGAYAFLVDEAHNLVDRSRDMFSAPLTKTAFLAMRRAVKSQHPSLYRAAGRINTWMLKARRQAQNAGGFHADACAPDGLEPLLRGFLRTAERWLAKNESAVYRDVVLEGYFATLGFIRIWERYDDSYVTCYRSTQKDLVLTLFCRDPSDHLRAALKRSRAGIFFSATLTPGGYFQQILGCGPSATKLAVASPFPRHHLKVLIADTVSTYYGQRDRSVDRIAGLVDALVRSKKGNYLCFFPSYAYMDMVVERFAERAPGIHHLVQTRDMDDAGRMRFLERFSTHNSFALVGFAVMGGIFGEGIDLVGDRLSGAVIVGVGLPAVCPERELIRRYFDRSRGAGFEFAYRYPGINRVLQAAGRVIRSDQDRGVVLLVDQRFTTPAYQALWPNHWSPEVVTTRRQLTLHLNRFWSGAV